MEGGEREVVVALDNLKFSAAHFVAFRGFRENLHGHNYTVGLRAGGPDLQDDGYLTDFGDFKKVARLACRELNSRTLVPVRSDVLQISRVGEGGNQVQIKCEDGAMICLPLVDCALVPITHSTAEELAEHLWWDMLESRKLGVLLLDRGVQWFEVSVSERPGQTAKYRALVSRVLRPELRDVGQPVRRPPAPCLSQVPGAACPAASPSASSDSGCLPQPTSAAAAVPPPPAPHAASRHRAVANDELQEEAFRLLLSTLGPEESARPELLRTPYRAAKAWREMTAGMRVDDPRSAIGEGVFDVEEAQDLVVMRDVPFHSLCEHHLLPFSGFANVAYLPRGRVLGLSKIPRLLNVFARRLQLQERLTAQFAEELERIVSPRAVAVALEATHGCMCHRGVGVGATTRTLVLRGPDRDDRSVKEQLVDGVAFSAASSARSRL